MKKLSLFSLFGLAGLLAFFAMPTYAQDVEDDLEADNAVVVSAEDDFNYWSDEEGVAYEDAIETEDLDEADNTTAFLWSEELENFLWELNIDDMSKEDAMATTWVLGALGGLLAGLWIAGIIFGIIWIIAVIIALWKAFEKAWEAGWKAIIPIYNVYIMYKIGWMKNWFWYSLIIIFILALIGSFLPDYETLLSNISSIIAGVIELVAMFKFARKYGWGTFTSILFAIFTGICILILGFWKSKYQGKSEETVVEA